VLLLWAALGGALSARREVSASPALPAMKKSVYVGNLPFSATETEIHELFSPFSHVHGVKIILDHETGRSRGFAFVELDADKAEAAIKGLEGKDMKGRPLKVNEARYRSTSGAGAVAK
jgi:RNA recognition motif-containing protein